MKNKFSSGVLTGAAISLIGATILFVLSFAFLTPDTLGKNALSYYERQENQNQNNIAGEDNFYDAYEDDVWDDFDANGEEEYYVETATNGRTILLNPKAKKKGVLGVDDDVMLEKIAYIRDMINNYSLYGATEEEMLDGIYRGLLWSIDDAYSTYYTAEEMQTLMESSSGIYCGIGVMVTQNIRTGIISIVKPFKNGPAANAGMKKEDILIKVEDEEVTGVDLNEVVARIKGEAGTPVKVTVKRGEEEIDMTIYRSMIEVPTIEYEMLDDNIGYISVSEFDEVTVDQFDKAITALEKQKMKGLVIDLRDNPGGLVDSAVAMLDRILPKGLVVYTEDKDGKREEEYAKDSKQLKVPLTLLMNENSASAAEIFAGAVQDFQKGKVVGTQSFGKGIVQVVSYLMDGSGIKFTVSQYFTPKGRAVHEVGITPDVKVELEEELKTLSEIPKDKDNQLQEAIKVLKEQIKKK